MMTPTATPLVGTMAIPSARQQFLDILKREHETTRRVVEAYPPEQSEFAPHPRSSNARRLVWTFAVEEYLLLAALKDELRVGGGFPNAPDAWGDVVGAFMKNHAEVIEGLDLARDEDFFGTVKFFTGPGAIGDVPKNEFMYFILS